MSLPKLRVLLDLEALFPIKTKASALDLSLPIA